MARRIHPDHSIELTPLDAVDKPEDFDLDGESPWTSEQSLEHDRQEASEELWTTIAGVAGNVLEWYDFAVFGYLSGVLGHVFFPPQAGDAATIESFAVFGGAFLMRPIGGIWMGYVGDKYGRKRALILSIFLMAFPTFLLGCLPTYDQIGYGAIILLVLVRLLQGLSVGGQLMSSLVYTLEKHTRAQWGLYGSFVMGAANCGSLIGSIAGFILRTTLTEEQLLAWGWRIPFLFGLVVSFPGLYLKAHGGDHTGHGPVSDCKTENADDDLSQESYSNPLDLALRRENLRSLGAAALVPAVWAGGFYLIFVWMPVFMGDLLDTPVPHPFGVNTLALLVSLCLFFPLAGMLSDRYGRRRIMTIGGSGLGILGPLAVLVIGSGNPFLAFGAQSVLGVCLSLWGAPMGAWLVESFAPNARLTSVAIGYNVAQALVGGSTPAVATLMVDRLGPQSPGWLLTVLAGLSLTGLLFVAPPPVRVVSGSPSVDFTPVPKSDAAAADASRASLECSEEEDENEVI